MSWPEEALSPRDGRLPVSVLGLGWVGAALVARLVSGAGRPLDVNVVVPSEAHRGSYLDLAHTIGFHPRHRLRWNDRDAYRDAAVVFHAAGASNPRGASRLSVAAANAALTREVLGGAGFRRAPFVVAIANPVDVVAWHAWRAIGAPDGRVIGTGTLLEAARLAYYLGEATGVAAADVDAWVLGEHGDAQVPIFSRTTVAGRPAREAATPAVLADCAERTRTAAWAVRATQPGTWWAVTDCAVEILRCLLGEDERTGPAGVRLEGAWAEALGGADAFVSLPVRLRQGGYDLVEPAAFGALDPDEWASLRAAAEVVAEATRA